MIGFFSRKKNLTSNSALMDDICLVVAVHEPFDLEDVVKTYRKLKSVDQLIETIKRAKDMKSSLFDAISPPPKINTDVKKKEVTKVDEIFKKNWLKRNSQKGLVGRIILKFGK